MRRTWFCLSGAFLLFISSSAVGQETPLDGLISKPQLSRQDKGVLNAEVAQRVKRLSEGGAKRDEARERILKPARTSGASKAFLDAYAQACAKELAGSPNAEDFDAALAATLILLEFDHPSVVEPLADALASKHPGVRYLAAQGLRKRAQAFRDDQALSSLVLRSMAKAAAAESDLLVARQLLAGMNLTTASGGFKHGAAGAGAVAEVLSTMAGGSGRLGSDEQLERLLCEAAAAYYPSARAEDQAALAGGILDLLKQAVGQAFDPSATLSDAVTARRIERLESTLKGFMTVSKAAPPARRVADAIKLRSSDNAKSQSEARSALAELMAVLRASPWNLQ